MNDTSFILLEVFNKLALPLYSHVNLIEKSGYSGLFLCWRNIDRHRKKGIILDTYSIMPCSTITCHIDISVPCCRAEIPLKVQRINLALCSKAQVQWRYNTSLSIFVATYGAIWRICRLTRIIHEIGLLNNVIAAGVLTIGNIFVKIFSLRNQSLLGWITDYICDYTINVFLSNLCKKRGQNWGTPLPLKPRKPQLRDIRLLTVTWGIFLLLSSPPLDNVCGGGLYDWQYTIQDAG